MELSELVGEHELTGCDMCSAGDANAIVFVLDGKTYAAAEDANDGYRSSLGTFEVSDIPVKNVFPVVRVVGRVEGEVLELLDVTTGKTVLQIGTDNADDYYPSFVASFAPENMVFNQ